MRTEQERALRELGHHAAAAMRTGGVVLAAWLDRFELAIAELTEDERQEVGDYFEARMDPVRKGLAKISRTRRAQNAEPQTEWASSRAWAWCSECGDCPVFVFDGGDTRCQGCRDNLAPPFQRAPSAEVREHHGEDRKGLEPEALHVPDVPRARLGPHRG